MYITINGTQYPCDGYKPVPGTRARFTGVTGLTLPVEGEVQLCRNDGFVMAVQNAEDYTRQTYENNVLTLTNEAEPEPIETVVEETTIVTEEDRLSMMLDHEYRLTLLELGV